MNKKLESESKLKRVILLFIFVLITLVVVLATENYSEKSLFGKKSSNSSYTQIKENYINTLKEFGPQKTLRRLEAEMKKNDFLASHCHELTHEIGRTVYLHNPSIKNALSYQNEICSSGYIHGLIEGLFVQENNLESSADYLISECGKISENDHARSQCFHGFGHGLMYYTQNELYKSLEYCEKATIINDVDACTSGVYMENFNTTDPSHKTIYLNKNDYFFPCAVQKDEHKSSCYLYSPLNFLNNNQNNYSEAMNWCSGAPEKYRTDCWYGVGFQGARRNPQDLNNINKVCLSDKREATVSCIGGFSLMYNLINNIRDKNEALKICEVVNSEYTYICKSYVENLSIF